MINRGNLLTALALALGIIRGQVDACSCYTKPALCDNIEEADIVLHATALSRQEAKLWWQYVHITSGVLITSIFLAMTCTVWWTEPYPT